MFSASDVANFLACHHLLTLDCGKAAGQIEKPYFYDPGIELLRELGARHEQAYLRHLIDQGLDVANIPTDVSWTEGAAQTVDALRRGACVIIKRRFKVAFGTGGLIFSSEFPNQAHSERGRMSR